MSSDQRSRQTPPRAPKRLVRARFGVLTIFFVNGATFSSLVPRYPQIIEQLHASTAAWGVVLGLAPAGGIVLGWAAAGLMSRFGSRNTAAVCQVLSTLALLGFVVAPSLLWVGAAMLVMSVFDALTDTAMNYHALVLQRAYGRSILNAFHGWWSIGAVAGGLAGSAMAQLRVPLVAQGAGTILVCSGLVALSRLLMLPRDGAGSEQHRAGRPRAAGLNPRTLAVLVGLGALGAFGAGIEQGGSSFAPLYMNEQFTVSAFVAGLGFVSLMVAQTAGRLLGDRLVDRLGQRRTVQLGALLCIAAMTLAIAVPAPVTALIGFACSGWGIATMVPAAMHAGDRVAGVAPGVGLVVTMWVMRVGLVLFPVVIGAIGDAVSLRMAMVLLPATAAGVLALSPLLGDGRAGRR
ncbi:MFS transporter [Propionibacterium australiense]|uniref:MFS transporter n=1 Tax=Propionibacterium australiense TaxID=119981 RepID=A0A383S5E6_9ACTN|nr:MFS transporter [Propionibacterium australiense]RLP08155.1 MFS transporter [Propionibacterium australiense]RLP08316.1 MFS transporter [Propionibacterium australiense]SYZ33063.1 Major facilitator superfamily (MFS) profile [Propionibacterium australiense]VEH89046.1 Inner membrane protein ybjJ [Propionibacterium australiense]